MRILVTGASGFVGGAIVQYLSKNIENALIIAVGRSLCCAFEGLKNVQYHQLDLSLPLPPITCDICIHSAGLADDQSSEAALFLHNVRVTQHLIDALVDCQQFIFVSSASVYDFSDGKLKKENDATSNTHLSAYGRSKLQAEKVVQAAAIPSVYILRPRAVYGKGDRVLLPRIQRLIHYGYLLAIGKMDVQNSLTSIQNFCLAIEKSIQQREKGVHIYNISDKASYRLIDVFRTILFWQTGSQKVLYFPLWFIRLLMVFSKKHLTEQALKYITQNAVLDISAAEKELDYAPLKDFWQSKAEIMFEV